MEESRSLRVFLTNGEVESYHHAEILECNVPDFLCIQVGLKTKKQILIPTKNISKIHQVIVHKEEEGENNEER